MPKSNLTSPILYITYDGLLEPLGYSQVVRYMERLSLEYRIVIISFEKSSDWQKGQSRDAMYKKMYNSGITWIPLRYHKRPSAIATLFDIMVGFSVSLYVVLRYRSKVVHARSYVPSVIALCIKKILGRKFIFDMRGFWADERVEGGLWPEAGILYRLAKWFERQFLQNADTVVSHTHSAVSEMQTWPFLKARPPLFEVIPTCTDLKHFQPVHEANSEQRPFHRPFTLGYVGSVGVWYLFDEVLECFKQLKTIRSDALLYIVNRGNHPFILDRMKIVGISLEDVKIVSLDATEVVHAIQRMDAGVFFIKPVYSKIASAPTKMGEFLACGVPCLSNAGIGDTEKIMEQENVGIIVRSMDRESIQDGLQRLLILASDEMVRKRCVEAARKHFSLDFGVTTYASIYEKLIKA